MKWALGLESAQRVRGVVELVASDPRVRIDSKRLDCDPYLLNTPSGTLDLRTGKQRAHDRADLITRSTSVAYDPAARDERWERFLADSLPDPDVRAFVQRAAGFSLCGENPEEAFFFIHGPASSGKSTFVDAVKAAMGDYQKPADFETFLRRMNVGGPRPGLVSLIGARAVFSVEVEEGRQLAEAILKVFTSGDQHSLRDLYKGNQDASFTGKLWLVANDAPRIRAEDGGVWRRIFRIPFDQVVPASRRDTQLKPYLKSEAREAVLAWLVAGFLAWRRAGGLNPPPSVVAATESLRVEMDPASRFVQDRCEFDRKGWVATRKLKTAYRHWAAEVGEDEKFPQDRLVRILRDHGCVPARGSRDKTTKIKLRGWKGASLRGGA